MVEPRESKTGLTEARGMWIEELWQRVITKCPGIVGYRSSWNEVIFFWPNKTSGDLLIEISGLLRDSIVSGLKSLALFSTITGTNESALRELERMELQLVKIGYWEKHIFDSYYEDGQEVPLHAA